MANQSFFPRREGDQLNWFTNLQSNTPAYYTTLDISTDRQAKLVIVLAWLGWTWGTLLPTRRQDAPAATAWRLQLATGTAGGGTITPPVPADLTLPAGEPFSGMLTWLFEEIARWKTAEGYDDTIGQTLAVIGSALNPPNYATIQPFLTAVASGGSVKIGWGWQGFGSFLDLCEIMVDRNDSKGFVPLAFDSTPNTEDTTPYPATSTKWTYKAIYRVNDHQVGQWSGVVSVVVGG